MLAARTKPWADRFYQVRDTLLGKIRMNDLRPLSYTKIAHEKGKYGKDVIKYSYSGSNVKGHCTRFRKNKEGNISESEKHSEQQDRYMTCCLYSTTCAS